MSVDTSTDQRDGESDGQTAVPPTVTEGWRYIMGAGVVITLLGVIAIFTPFLTGIGISVVLGLLLLVGAGTHFVQLFYAGSWRRAIWQVVLGVVYAVAGVALLVNPGLGLVTLTVLLIAYFAVEGVAEIALGVRMRGEPQWGWFAVSGVVSLLLAGLLFAGFPSTALWAVGLLFGVNLISTGVSMLSVGNIGRKAVRASDGAVVANEPSA
jgi:uncharacterized membrane protein HdeD (DUF308 family)